MFIFWAPKNSNDCIDRGHWTAGSLLTEGEYWLVVDSWVNNSGEEKDGEFGLEIGFTLFDDFVNAGMGNDFAEDALFAFDAFGASLRPVDWSIL